MLTDQELLEKLFDTDFKRMRNNLALHFVKPVLDVVLSYYNIQYEGLENIPETGPALVIPKHVSWQDTPIPPYAVYKAAHRLSYLIEKGALPTWMEYLGGLRVIRQRDVANFAKKGRWVMPGVVHPSVTISKEFKKKYNEQLLGYAAFLLYRGKIIINWAEGHRYVKEMGKIKPKVIEATVLEQKKSGSIPIVCMGMEFSHKNVPRSRVYVRIGEPIIVPPDYPVGELTTRIQKNLAELSNIRL